MYEVRLIGTDIVVISDVLADAIEIIGYMNDGNHRISAKFNASYR